MKKVTILMCVLFACSCVFASEFSLDGANGTVNRTGDIISTKTVFNDIGQVNEVLTKHNVETVGPLTVKYIETETKFNCSTYTMQNTYVKFYGHDGSIVAEHSDPEWQKDETGMVKNLCDMIP